jgi:hypothetical protein
MFVNLPHDTNLVLYKATLNSCGASSKIAHAADKSLERGAHPTHLVWTRHGLLGCPAKCRRGNVWHDGDHPPTPRMWGKGNSQGISSLYSDFRIYYQGTFACHLISQSSSIYRADPLRLDLDHEDRVYVYP